MNTENINADVFREAINEEIRKKIKNLDIFFKEVSWHKQCNKSKGDNCEHGHCRYSVLLLGQTSGFFCGRNDDIKT